MMKLNCTLMAFAAMTNMISGATLAVNFTGVDGDTPGSAAFGVAAGDWNNAAGNANAGLLVTADNSDSATLVYNAPGVWRTGGVVTTGEEAVIRGYFDDHSGGIAADANITLNMSSIASGTYSLTIYHGSDITNVADFNDVNVNGADYDVTPLGSFGGLSGSHAITTINSLSGDLTIISPGRNSGGAGHRGTISGFQITYVPVPEPSSAVLVGLGGFAVMLRRHR